MHGGYVIGKANAEGKSIQYFSLVFDLTIANMCFRMREEHLITYKSGVSYSQIDFFFTRKSNRKPYMDCKVIPEESLFMDVRSKRIVRERTITRFQESCGGN